MVRLRDHTKYHREWSHGVGCPYCDLSVAMYEELIGEAYVEALTGYARWWEVPEASLISQ